MKTKTNTIPVFKVKEQTRRKPDAKIIIKMRAYPSDFDAELVKLRKEAGEKLTATSARGVIYLYS